MVVPETVVPPVVTCAVIVLVPAASRVATPLALMVATVVLLLVHCTRLVMSFVELSAKVPVAVKACVPAVTKTAGFDGVIPIEESLVAVTVRVAEAFLPSLAAEMVLVPAATAVATPDELTVAVLVEEDVQVAEVVMSVLLPPTVLPLAVKFTVFPTTTSAPVGLTVTESRVSSETKNLPQPVVPNSMRAMRA